MERFEGRDGAVVLSRDKARREEAWTVLEKAYEAEERVTGVIFGRVKGGFTVDLSGAVAFLPGSQVDIRPIRDVAPLMGNPQQFQILKMDRSRGNIVVSRRAVLEETRAEERSELMSNLSEGQVLEGVVKNITDYGALLWGTLGSTDKAAKIPIRMSIPLARLSECCVSGRGGSSCTRLQVREFAQAEAWGIKARTNLQQIFDDPDKRL